MKQLTCRMILAAFIGFILPVSAAERPNILWITSEDNGPQLGCYGDPYAVTPNIDALAKRGLRYLNAWSTAPVCAPARTTIITGVYGPSNGSEHMRSEVGLPSFMKLFPTFLRDQGYYVSNNSKEDYNLKKSAGTWDKSSTKATWKNRAPGQPFFSVFNHTISHESQIRNEIDDKDRIHDPAKARIPAYQPDVPEVRKDWAQYYDRITMMDALVGQNLKDLEEAGLAADTIVFYYGDHGSGMPRSKRWPYNSGLLVPLVVYFPPKWQHLAPKDYVADGATARLVGFIDLAPTVLSLAGIKPLKWMQGHAFAGEFDTKPQEYLHGFRGRMDERYDFVRSIRDERYIYIRNYNPHKIYGQFIEYMFRTPTTRVWKELFDAGKLTEVQSRFWKTKPPEELYDLQSDPDEVDNLTDSADHKRILARLKKEQRRHALAIRDLGFLPENEVHSRDPAAPPYTMGHDEWAYDMKPVMEMAEAASSLDPDAMKELKKGFTSGDSAVRYWAAMGILMRGPDAVVEAHDELWKLLTDKSPAPRITAAEALGRYGNDADAARALEVLVEAAPVDQNGPYVAMMALNAIDSMGIRARSDEAAIAVLPTDAAGVPKKFGDYIPNLLKSIQMNLNP
jgi:arylsulfatase A-like enzyme